MQMNDPGAKGKKAGLCTVRLNQVSRAIIGKSRRVRPKHIIQGADQFENFSKRRC